MWEEKGRTCVDKNTMELIVLCRYPKLSIYVWQCMSVLSDFDNDDIDNSIMNNNGLSQLIKTESVLQ